MALTKGITMTTITVHLPAAVLAPRGAAFFGSVYSTIAAGLTAWSQTRLQRRAAATRASEIADLRAYAWGLMKEDRRYAADLLAAADRHEQG